MRQRRILVIGSQCEALGDLSRLLFLPQAAQELYAVMTDPERGACISALEGNGLLIDPTIKDATDAIELAYRRAATDEATLFIAYIGHGEKMDEDCYLLPQDAKVHPLNSRTAVHLINLIKEAQRNAPGKVDGLGVLLDACYSGIAGFGAAQAWVAALKGTLRFEMLTAAADRPAADGCFSRTLVRLLRDGVSTVPSERLLGLHLRPLIERSCPNQAPQHPSYNPTRRCGSHGM
jgi:Caspase domain